MKFRVKACDRAGTSSERIFEAADVGEASERASEAGLFVLSVEAVASERQQGSGDSIRGKAKRIASFARELSVLVSTATPLVDALGALERQAKDDAWRRLVGDIRKRVEEGAPLSEALEAHPRVFDPVFRGLVSAGESSGKLHLLLQRLASMTRQQAKTRSLLIGSLMYPSLLLTVSGSVLICMLLFVVPRFAGLFDTLGAPLPVTTKAMMVISVFIREYWWLVLTLLAAAGTGLGLSIRGPRGRRRRDRAVLAIPILGALIRNVLTARVARLLGVLLQSHVPMLEALALTRAAVPNMLYQDWLEEASDAATRGESISSVCDESTLLAPSVAEAVRNGEQSGRLAEVLSDLADYLDEDNESTARSMSSLLEPVIMICLGVVVAFVAISMFLPLFDLTASAGSGP